MRAHVVEIERSTGERHLDDRAGRRGDRRRDGGAMVAGTRRRIRSRLREPSMGRGASALPDAGPTLTETPSGSSGDVMSVITKRRLLTNDWTSNVADAEMAIARFDRDGDCQVVFFEI